MELLLRKMSKILHRVHHGKAVIAALAVIVVIGTASALILPAKTMDADTAGKEPGVSLEQEDGKTATEAASDNLNNSGTAQRTDQENAGNAAAEDEAAEIESEESGTGDASDPEISEAEKTDQGDADATDETSDPKEGDASDENAEEIAFAGKKTYKDSKIAITAAYGAKANIPEEAVLKVEEIDSESEGGTESCQYKIGFFVNGEEIEPEDTISLRVRFLDGKFADADDIRVVHYLDSSDADHVTEDMKTEKIEAETSAGKDGSIQAEFEMDSFSIVEFQATDGASTYAISGNSTIEVGETVTLTGSSGGYNNTWSSSDTSIATVTGSGNSATVTGVSVGTVTITHTYGWWQEETITVTVTAASGKQTISFDGNGGTGSVKSIEAEVGEEITFPENGFTRTEYVFVGWSTNSNANDEGSANHRSSIYQPGDSYTVDKTETFYAIWATTDTSATFYIRLDGTIPTEPAPVDSNVSYAAAAYTKGVTISNVLKEAKFYANTGGVNDNLNQVPTNDQIVAMINDSSNDLGFSAEVRIVNEVEGVYVSNISNSSASAVENVGLEVNDEIYVLWYVVKHESAGPTLSGYSQTTWHVDGTLLVKSKVNLVYDSNAPAGVIDKMPVGTQWIRNSTVKAGTTDIENENIVTPSRNDGYTFAGWKKYTKDASGNYTVTDGTIYNSGEEFVITEDTQLVAQWVKDKAVLTVRKTDGNGNPIDTATFTLDEVAGSTQGGSISFGSIDLNEIHTLVETEAPDGYEKRTDVIRFMEMKKDADYSVVFYGESNREITRPEWLGVSFTGSNLTLTISDERSTADITIKKVDTSNNSITLSGAEFVLRNSDGNYYAVADSEDISWVNEQTGATTIKTGTGGTVSVSGLPTGIYTLIETKAPEGYNLLSEEIEFTVNKEEIRLSDGSGVSVDEEDKRMLIVSNSAGIALPETGGIGTLPYTFGGLLILAAGLMYGCSMRRRGERGTR